MSRNPTTFRATALFGGAAIAAAAAAGSALADEVSPNSVSFGDYGAVEAALTATPGDATSGRAVFSNRRQGNCLACHVNSDHADEAFHGEVGPMMDGVADRYSTAELRGILVDSKRFFGDHTIMPGFYSMNVGHRTAEKFEGKTVLSAQQVEDVLAYLMTLKEN